MEEEKDKKTLVLETLKEIPTETKVDAYVFEMDGAFYHLAIYNAFRIGKQGAIWNANKKGKRLEKDHIFMVNAKDADKCIDAFIKHRETV
jgi:hypothetical protein